MSFRLVKTQISVASTADLCFKDWLKTSVKDDVNKHHETEAWIPSFKGEEKGTDGPTPKGVSISEIGDVQCACPVINIAERLPPHSIPGSCAVLSDSMSGPHAQPCNLNEKTQPKQSMKSIIEDPKAQKLLDAVAKRIIAADEAKMDVFEASFRWASPRPANKKLESDPKSSAHSDYPDSVPSGAAYSATPGSSAGEPVSTYGPFESAGYAKLPSPCGSFENESYITRLCHNEENSAHVDEKQNKIKLCSKIFKKG